MLEIYPSLCLKWLTYLKKDVYNVRVSSIEYVRKLKYSFNAKNK